MWSRTTFTEPHSNGRAVRSTEKVQDMVEEEEEEAQVLQACPPQPARIEHLVLYRNPLQLEIAIEQQLLDHVLVSISNA